MWWCLLFLLVNSSSSYILLFGGLFDENIPDVEVFNEAVNALDRFDYSPISFSYLTEQFLETGPYGALTSTCSLLSKQAVVIFGPRNEENIHIVQATCDYKDIPHVITRWVYKHQETSSMINFYPHSKYLTAAYLAVVRLWEWKSFTVFYDDNESILRVAELIRDAKNLGVIVTVKKLDKVGNGNYRTSMKEALLSGETRYVIDCKIELLEAVLTHAQQVGLMTSAFSYFITNLDMHTINWEPFQYSKANITGIKLVNSESVNPESYYVPANVSTFKTEAALLIDAVTILAEAIRNHGDVNMGRVRVNCNSSKAFRHGATISSKVKSGKYNGLTGHIEFDNEGLRSNFNLDVLELNEEGLAKIGTWNYSKGISTIRYDEIIFDDDPNSLRNKTFKVLTCLTEPYCMLKESATSLVGNDRFEGFAIDLIHKLSLIEGFNYTFIIREDKANGAKDPTTGKWSGMIGDIMSNKSDLAITDLTITAQREEAVDFTSPFMNLGISILAKKPINDPPSFFSFADPFALDTWIAIAVSYTLVTVSFFIIGRMCPDEWDNPYPCVEEPEHLINQFTFQNSAWYAMGTFLQQGSEIAPIGVSTRMLAGMWWFFILIMVSTYTANLAAFLATVNPTLLFSDVETLVQNKEKYNLSWGAKDKGATENFFHSQKNNSVYQAIAEYMKTHQGVSENRFGVKRAEEERFAFFMESTGIEYEIQRHCTLQEYGKTLDDKGYGIAMRKNSPYRKKLSLAILKLQASGDLDGMKRKWWEEKRGGGQCNTQSDSSTAAPLYLPNLQGVFVVTIGGTALSVVLVTIQMLVAAYKYKLRAKITFKEAYKSEMKIFLNFASNVKPALPATSGSGSSTSRSRTGSRKSFNNNMKQVPYGFTPAVTGDELPGKS